MFNFVRVRKVARLLCLGVLAVSALASSVLFAQQKKHESLRVAVASNFSATAVELLELFEQQNDVDTQLNIGSTGKLTSQIEFGLDVDVFLAADRERPTYLIEKGLVIGDKGFTYALGRLMLWSPKANTVIDKQTFDDDNLKHLAMANPRLAPYGRAAQQTIEAMGISLQLKDKIVFGENVSQTLQFARSGNAEYAFIAQSQYLALGSGSTWLVPQTMYDPVEQHAVQLSQSSIASLFMQFLDSETARDIIVKHGYGLPNG